MEKLVVISDKELHVIDEKGNIIDIIFTDDKDLIEYYKTQYKEVVYNGKKKRRFKKIGN